jgi:hypothetical protein
MIRELVELTYREQVPLSQLIGHAPFSANVCKRPRTVEILVPYVFADTLFMVAMEGEEEW